MNEIVPFGKYKGQPVDVLRSDPSYCEWLQAQDWVQSRFPELRTLIINNFAEPSETPEHNALQARFLDKRFRAAVVVSARTKKIKSRRVIKNVLDNLVVHYEFELKGIDVVLRSKEATFLVNVDDDEYFDYVYSLRYKDIQRRTKELKEKHDPRWWGFKNSEVEKEDFDKALAELNKESSSLLFSSELENTFENEFSGEFLVEVKPFMGDDYPAVLRQIRASATAPGFIGWPVLVVGSYAGTSVSLEQVKTIFYASNVRVVLVSEIDALLSL